MRLGWLCAKVSTLGFLVFKWTWSELSRSSSHSRCPETSGYFFWELQRTGCWRRRFQELVCSAFPPGRPRLGCTHPRAAPPKHCDIYSVLRLKSFNLLLDVHVVQTSGKVVNDSDHHSAPGCTMFSSIALSPLHSFIKIYPEPIKSPVDNINSLAHEVSKGWSWVCDLKTSY